MSELVEQIAKLETKANQLKDSVSIHTAFNHNKNQSTSTLSLR